VAHSEALVGWTPAGTIVHMPNDVGNPHDMQVPSHALSQQYPSAQKLLLHSEGHVQGSPLSLFGPPPSLAPGLGQEMGIVDASPPPAPSRLLFVEVEQAPTRSTASAAAHRL